MAHAGNKNVHGSPGHTTSEAPSPCTSGVTLFGDGRANTVIAAGGDFDPAATGIIILQGRERGSAGVRDLRHRTGRRCWTRSPRRTAPAATGATTITLASAANVYVNDYVFNNSRANSISPWTLVTAIAGAT